jgi:hypothetical protein
MIYSLNTVSFIGFLMEQAAPSLQGVELSLLVHPFARDYPSVLQAGLSGLRVRVQVPASLENDIGVLSVGERLFVQGELVGSEHFQPHLNESRPLVDASRIERINVIQGVSPTTHSNGGSSV